MKAKASMQFTSDKYESPVADVIVVESEGVICDSNLSGNTDSFEEKYDWDLNW